MQGAKKAGYGELKIDGGKLQECWVMSSEELLQTLHTVGQVLCAVRSYVRYSSHTDIHSHAYTAYTHMQIDIRI